MAAGCAVLGFDHFILSCHVRTKYDIIANATLTSLSDDFREEYVRLRWADDDMCADRALTSDATFFWNSEDERSADQRGQGYVDFLKARRMKMGVVSPLERGPEDTSLFAMVSLTDMPPRRGVAQAATILGGFAKAKADMLGLNSAIASGETIALRSLSALQRTILDWIAEGKSNGDIATILDLPERKIRYHVSAILRKLGVVTRAQAAEIAREGRERSSQ